MRTGEADQQTLNLKGDNPQVWSLGKSMNPLPHVIELHPVTDQLRTELHSKPENTDILLDGMEQVDIVESDVVFVPKIGSHWRISKAHRLNRYSKAWDMNESFFNGFWLFTRTFLLHISKEREAMEIRRAFIHRFPVLILREADKLWGVSKKMVCTRKTLATFDLFSENRRKICLGFCGKNHGDFTHFSILCAAFAQNSYAKSHRSTRRHKAYDQEDGCAYWDDKRVWFEGYWRTIG